MTMRAFRALVVGSAMLLAGGVGAGEPQKKPAAALEARAVFEQLKTLAGEWEGTGRSGQEQMPAAVRYRVASGGTVVEETLFAGTPHEMVSMYHLEGSELVLTHYCAMGNQPRLRLDRSASRADELRFTFAGGTNLDPAKDGHIHGLTLRTAGADLHHDWLSWKDGKEAGHMRLALARKKAAAPAARSAP